jgi:hypothetical protein
MQGAQRIRWHAVTTGCSEHRLAASEGVSASPFDSDESAGRCAIAARIVSGSIARSHAAQ